MGMKAISAARLFDGTHYHHDAALIWNNDVIEAILPIAELPSDIEHQHYADAVIAPGFIDLQVNGGGDVMFNSDITASAIDTICRAHRKHGTAYLLPTLISSTPQDISQALTATEQAIEAHVPGVIGVHLEGPWLSKEKKGAHNAELFYSPTINDLADFPWPKQAKVLVTAAVENMSDETLDWLQQQGVTLSCGHSNAIAAQLTPRKLSRIDGFTHLFNAMSAFEGREPGVIGTALHTDHAWCSIITDGIHVHPNNVMLAQKVKPAGKLLIVTDAMATLGSETNRFELDGQVIEVIDNKLVNSEGRLAGAHIGMDESVANVIAWGIDEAEALRMASTYPAQAMNLTQLGQLKPGYRAAATVLSNDYQSQAVLVDGQLL
ncbi:N-acetylglucosamine-6-phosphate deacetylase [Vibrio scophthalmi]|uniref:N-acetylglucosamine-6-phosphate deacetylase n=1 Tax=Vibrio scophthalmi TaxID=45658 RepID=UPI002283EEC6|nr:N-acetylglucosamine-6-phosphate deacetylase [Vibrio scophthalmi]MCY9802393.1 N-acetylglucosamine-6-phosphate deacetylase [Vibrio scophthalmi]